MQGHTVTKTEGSQKEEFSPMASNMRSGIKHKFKLEPRNTSNASECTNDAAYINALVQEASIDNSNQQNDLGMFYGDLSNLSRP